MFKRFLDLITKSGTSMPINMEVNALGTLIPRELLVSVAVIFIEMAGRDNTMAKEEAELVVTLFTRHFGLPEDAVPPLIREALDERKKVEKIDPFVKLINESYSDSQRQKLLAMIWKIVAADGQADTAERRFAIQMKNRFRLSDAIDAEAQRMAETHLV